VHAETVRVVDEQTRDLDVKMRDLDDFVTRARSENAKHLSQHSKSMQALASTVDASFSSISSHFKETFGRVKDLSTGVEEGVEQLHETLDTLDETVIQPLSGLRNDISTTVLREYQPTGETPERVRYQYRTDLPRTEAHEVLIAGLTDAPTPTKSVPVIFSDLDASEQARSPPLPASNLDLGRGHFSMSLREVNPNLTTGSIMFDPAASTMSMQADNTMPLFRRSARQPKKQAMKGRNAVVTMEGRENVPPTAFSQSLSRRKSPRLN
jgi:kinesin family member 11